MTTSRVPAFAVLLLLLSRAAIAAEPDTHDRTSDPSRLLQFTAGLNRIGAPGPAVVTFAVYRDQLGGEPLWSETQSVTVDERGKFEAVLGAIERIPLQIFRSGEARWLGVQRMPEAEQPRILLAAVPYALKAADAETLGGKPLSAFVLAEPTGSPEDDRGHDATPSARVTTPAGTLPGGTRDASGGFGLRTVTNAAVATGFQLTSVAGNTSVGFAATGGDWRVYLKPSSAAGFDTADLRLRVSSTQLWMFGSVVGQSNGNGVVGYGLGDTGVGVHGEGNHIGVRGVSANTAGLDYGVYAQGAEYGVYAMADATAGIAMGGRFLGGDTGATNTGVFASAGDWGVWAETTTGVAILARSSGGDLIRGIGPTQMNDMKFRVTGAGDVHYDGALTNPAADLAERIDPTETLSPGDVVEIDPSVPSGFRLSRSARSTLVVGVISTLPAIILNDKMLRNIPDDNRPALALAGQVPVKVSAENGPIALGDLLVASSTPGHAMRADADPAPGTVVGKALSALQSGQGTIRMIVLFR